MAQGKYSPPQPEPQPKVKRKVGDEVMIGDKLGVITEATDAHYSVRIEGEPGVRGCVKDSDLE